ncbi:hypothetical protein GQ44DRAFT_773561 [Phaeosphaeriaceae sp. PMI808]|nr:hypothetical protein GQ44DRAFT_773561 [Phaeosphaeriaceae sp. PMI808]
MAEVYDTTRFGQLYYASRQPSSDQLGLAAIHVTASLNQYSLPNAIIGGWAVFLRGGARQTLDVDLTVSTTMPYLKSVLLLDRRICFPLTHGSTSVQIFVWVGRSFDASAPNAPDYAVSMDLVLSGNLGIPASLNGACENIKPIDNTPHGGSAVVLSIFYQLYAKFGAFSSRGTTTDNDFNDLVFLLNKHANEIPPLRQSLNSNQRRSFFQTYSQKYVGYDDSIMHMKGLLGLE